MFTHYTPPRLISSHYMKCMPIVAISISCLVQGIFYEKKNTTDGFRWWFGAWDFEILIFYFNFCCLDKHILLDAFLIEIRESHINCIVCLTFQVVYSLNTWIVRKIAGNYTISKLDMKLWYLYEIVLAICDAMMMLMTMATAIATITVFFFSFS